MRSRRLRISSLFLLLLVFAMAPISGCASGGPKVEPLRDPWEPMNRGVFAFNEGLDYALLAPLAGIFEALIPAPIRGGVDRFFDNLVFPIDLGNNLMQGKWRDAGIATGRFITNSTVGILGFFDPATGWGMERQPEDFGQTLAVWGMGSGPYLVLPLLGPSSPRDTIGIGTDVFLFAYSYVVDAQFIIGAKVIQVVNGRSIIRADVRDARESAFDYYVFVRDAYEQIRRDRILDGQIRGPGRSDSGVLQEDPYDEDLYDEDLYDEDLYDENAGPEGAAPSGGSSEENP